MFASLWDSVQVHTLDTTNFATFQSTIQYDTSSDSFWLWNGSWKKLPYQKTLGDDSIMYPYYSITWNHVTIKWSDQESTAVQKNAEAWLKQSELKKEAEERKLKDKEKTTKSKALEEKMKQSEWLMNILSQEAENVWINSNILEWLLDEDLNFIPSNDESTFDMLIEILWAVQKYVDTIIIENLEEIETIDEINKKITKYRSLHKKTAKEYTDMRWHVNSEPKIAKNREVRNLKSKLDKAIEKKKNLKDAQKTYNHNEEKKKLKNQLITWSDIQEEALSKL